MSSLLLLALLVSVNGFMSITPAFCDTMRFEMIHRHSPELSGRLGAGLQKTRLEQVRELVRLDEQRTQMIYHRIGQRTERRKDAEGGADGQIGAAAWTGKVIGSSGASVPMFSGSFAGEGLYFVPFRVGTPAQNVLLVADTGSDLTWMNCIHGCRNCGRKVDRRRFFNADLSSSFTTIPCLSRMCKNDLAVMFSLTDCPKPLNPCKYDYSYSSGQSAQGFFANESVTVRLTNGRKMKIHHVLVGCTQTTQGQKFSNVVDGILGLGYSPNSFATKVLQVFGSKFSYCLVDHLSPRNVSNYLVFGRNHIVNVNPPEMQYTELMVGKVLPYYAVNVIGISIGGVLLRIPLSVWNLDKNGGTILDSGTSLTLLVEPAYRLVIDALKVALIMYKKAEVPEFEVCIKVDKAFDEGLVPRLGIHFAGGARLLPPVKSYLIDVADGIKCLGFRSVFWPGISVIGNIMQQNFFWELDLRRERVGFAPSSCA